MLDKRASAFAPPRRDTAMARRPSLSRSESAFSETPCLFNFVVASNAHIAPRVGRSQSTVVALILGEAPARLAFNRRDASFYNDTNFGHLAEADMIDFNLSYAPSNALWRLSFYGDNLMNEVT